jgi:Heterokaryon incompatibility protein (HET)
LCVPNALLVEKGLPRTIEHACQATHALGETYLWVDALCMVQDDSQSKMHDIRQMYGIYAGALLAIVANCSIDAESGLTSVIPGSWRPCQDGVVFPEGTMISGAFNLNSTLELSPWNTRGWTLQEKILSRRCLVVGIDQVSWECSCDSWCEETVLEVAQPKNSRPLRGLIV